MNYFILLIPTLITLNSCDFKRDDDHFKFGRQYNLIRKDFGAPLIKSNMEAHNCCGNWTTYTIKEKPIDNKPYHHYKAICTIIDDKVVEEEDVYRQNINDTTLLQLNIHVVYDWKKKSLLLIDANIGKVDKKSIALEDKDLSNTNLQQYTKYMWQTLSNLTKLDSTLNSLGLSRFDKE